MNFPRNIMFSDDTDTTYTLTVTANSTIHTKGTYVEIFSALAFDVYQVELFVAEVGLSTVDTSALLDVGADSAGGTSYTEIIPNFLIGCVRESGEFSNGYTSIFPVFIPAGATVAVRTQSISSSDTVEVGMKLHGGSPDGDPFPNHGLVVAYGVTVSSSSGITPANAVTNVEGAWTEVVSATTHPHRGLTIGVQAADGTIGTDDYLIDIATGAGGSEVVIIEGIPVHTHGNEQLRILDAGAFRHDIPEGTRLAVRAQADAANVQDDIDVALYGTM